MYVCVCDVHYFMFVCMLFIILIYIFSSVCMMGMFMMMFRCVDQPYLYLISSIHQAHSRKMERGVEEEKICHPYHFIQNQNDNNNNDDDENNVINYKNKSSLLLLLLFVMDFEFLFVCLLLLSNCLYCVMMTLIIIENTTTSHHIHILI